MISLSLDIHKTHFYIGIVRERLLYRFLLKLCFFFFLVPSSAPLSEINESYRRTRLRNPRSLSSCWELQPSHFLLLNPGSPSLFLSLASFQLQTFKRCRQDFIFSLRHYFPSPLHLTLTFGVLLPSVATQVSPPSLLPAKGFTFNTPPSLCA